MEGDRQKTSKPSWSSALPYPSLLLQQPSAGTRSLCVEGIFCHHQNCWHSSVYFHSVLHHGVNNTDNKYGNILYGKILLQEGMLNPLFGTIVWLPAGSTTSLTHILVNRRGMPACWDYVETVLPPVYIATDPFSWVSVPQCVLFLHRWDKFFI